MTRLTRVRPILGLSVLTIIIVWVSKEGVLLQELNWQLIFASTLVSLTLSFVNADCLKVMTRAYATELKFFSALHISALGSLGNALGGLPIGTTLKYAILHKKFCLSITQITVGFVTFSATISAFLLLFAAVGSTGVNLPPGIKYFLAIFAALCIFFIPLFILWLQRNARVKPLLAPYWHGRTLLKILILSFSTASLFLFNYWVISRFLFPTIPLLELIFMSAVGILVGLGSVLQSVGGVQELSMGMAAYISGAEILDGVQLALVMRITSIIAPAIILMAMYFTPVVYFSENLVSRK